MKRSLSRTWAHGYVDLVRSRYWTLLLSIMTLFITSPFLEYSLSDRLTYAVITLVVLVAAIRASTYANHRMRHIAAATAFAWLVVMVVRLVWPGDAQEMAGDGVFLAMSVFTLGAILGRVLTAKRVDFDILCGTATAYLLLALIWAITYLIIETGWPGSFSGLTRRDLTEFLYFSLMTITTLGYGDIVPISDWARIWAGLQAVIGVFYMAAVVARLVNAYER